MATNKKKQPDGRSKKRPGVEEQKEIITAAAIDLFIEQGTTNTSIAQICSHAEVSKPTFYRCFKDKDELVSNLYHTAINEHVETLLVSTYSETFSGKHNLDNALDDLFDAIFAESHLAQLLFREYGDPNSPATKIIDNAFERIARVMEKTLKQRSQKPPSRTFLKAIMAAFQWIVYDAIKAGLTPKKVKEAKCAAHELASTLFARK